MSTQTLLDADLQTRSLSFTYNKSFKTQEVQTLTVDLAPLDDVSIDKSNGVNDM